MTGYTTKEIANQTDAETLTVWAWEAYAKAGDREMKDAWGKAYEALAAVRSIEQGRKYNEPGDTTIPPYVSPSEAQRARIREEINQEMLDFIDGDPENGPRYGVEPPDEAEIEAEITRRIAEENEPEEPDQDGPAGDYLGNYWFNAEGPDEPSELTEQGEW